jgi:hypothetical protein
MLHEAVKRWVRGKEQKLGTDGSLLLRGHWGCGTSSWGKGEREGGEDVLIYIYIIYIYIYRNVDTYIYRRYIRVCVYTYTLYIETYRHRYLYMCTVLSPSSAGLNDLFCPLE